MLGPSRSSFMSLDLSGADKVLSLSLARRAFSSGAGELKAEG